MPMLHWTDERTPPRLISANNPNKEDWTGNEHDMYPTIDQVQINLRAEPEAWERREAVLTCEPRRQHAQPGQAAGAHRP